MIKYKVLVAGSRIFKHYPLFKATMDEEMKRITADCKIFDHTPVIISGGALGTDTMAEKYAKENNILFEEYPADWGTYGKSAGPIRNKQMADIAVEAIIFWDGYSRGTMNMISNMKKLGKQVKVYQIEV